MNTSNTLPPAFSARLCSALVLLAALQGCATTGVTSRNPLDPWEPFNRGVYSFNEGLDAAILKPVAKAYQQVTPSPVRTGVNNFFGNLSDVWSFVNNVLQLKPKESAETLMRVAMNTFFGFGGVLDLATELRLEKHKEDFGRTLGHWGVATGPYVVLPVLGSSTLRDTLAMPVNNKGDLVTRIDDVETRNTLFALRVVDLRASFLNAGDLLDGAALDKYSFARDAYLQRRRVAGQSQDDLPGQEERFDLPEDPAPGRPLAPPLSMSAEGGVSTLGATRTPKPVTYFLTDIS